ncbi:MAG: hypothetical protein LBR24_03245, partial [Methanobrevibacter sp.]|nr:hypothetical protein [Methanobrevibacter sp.]
MKPLILKAENSKEISKKAQPFLDKKFKVISEDKVHIILKKRNFGSIIIHILFWILILFAHPSVFGDLFAIIPSLSAFFKSSLFVNNYYYIIC